MCVLPTQQGARVFSLTLWVHDRRNRQALFYSMQINWTEQSGAGGGGWGGKFFCNLL